MLELCTRPENTRPVVVITTLEGDDVTVAKCKEQPEKQRMGIWNHGESRYMDCGVLWGTVGYTRKNLTTCSKSANKLSTSCVARTICYKLSTSLEQALNNL